MAGLVRRRLYKPERAPARAKNAIGSRSPVMLTDATDREVASALAVLGQGCGIVIGLGRDYEPIRDEYTVTAKNRATGKVGDYRIPGSDVAQVIMLARMMYGGRHA